MNRFPDVCTCLFVQDQALEMAEFYVALLPGSEIVSIHRIGESEPFLVEFTLRGTPFRTMNGNLTFEARPDHSISITVSGQAEVDRLWNVLAEGGAEGPCGWVKDRFGIHWQVIPDALPRLMSSGDPETSRRVQAALQAMKKIEVDGLEKAAVSAS